MPAHSLTAHATHTYRHQQRQLEPEHISAPRTLLAKDPPFKRARPADTKRQTARQPAALSGSANARVAPHDACGRESAHNEREGEHRAKVTRALGDKLVALRSLLLVLLLRLARRRELLSLLLHVVACLRELFGGERVGGVERRRALQRGHGLRESGKGA
eukprot:637689-Rhodomonas_salina.1